MTAGLCRDCLAAWRDAPAGRCPACGSPRLVRHAELDALAVAHIDCDAFYASIEKRDDPALRDRPVIVGGETRGVVAACCYIARIRGVRSAMPMFQARRLCPDAVIRPVDMPRYREAGRAIRALMEEATPLVEPLSIDEAFLDLTGTERLHHGSPARTLAALVRRIEREVGVTASVGLSYNKFLAKVASDLDKPRGFAVIGRAEAPGFLEPRPVGLLWGVGAALARRLERDGIRTVGDLRRWPEAELVARHGSIGHRLYRFARGEDDRRVTPDSPAKSLSAETTFATDVSDPRELAARLWPLCERVAERLRRHQVAAGSVVLKLKTADFRLLTRTRRLTAPTRLADTLFRAAEAALRAEADGRAFRLIGVGAAALSDPALADPPDLADPGGSQRRARLEAVMEAVRGKYGRPAIVKGRGFGPPPAKSDKDT